jgi:hypothetical protein
MLEKKRQKGPECNSGIQDRDTKRQLHLKKERTSGRIFIGLGIAKRIAGSSMMF